MIPRGQHVILDFFECQCDLKYLEQVSQNTSLIEKLKPLFDVRETVPVQFEPTGYSFVLVLGESHISMHTWPEDKIVLIDLFTCNGKIPIEAIEAFEKFFQPRLHSQVQVERGKLSPAIESQTHTHWHSLLQPEAISDENDSLPVEV